MDVIKLLEYLQEILETSSKLPMSNKIIVNKKEVYEIIDQIINCLPDELKKAQWVCEEKEKILIDAQEQAENLKKEALEIIKKKIENHDLVKEAEEKSNGMLIEAQKRSKIIKDGVKEYTLEVLQETDENINKTYAEFMQKVQKEMEVFRMNMENQIRATTSNLQENINEMEKY